MKRALTRTISRNAVGLITLSVVFLTGWSGIWAWIGGNFEGMKWIQMGSGLSQELLSDVPVHQHQRAELLSQKPRRSLTRELAAGEVAILHRHGRPTGYFSEQLPIASEHANALAQVTASGFYPLDHSLFYVTCLKFPEERFLLAKTVSEIVTKLAHLSLAEYILFDAQGRAILSTIRNTKGETLYPQLSSVDLTSPGKITVAAPDYGGFSVGEDVPVLYRGVQSFEAFVAAQPVPGPDQKPIGYLAMIAPTDLLLGNVKLGILGSSILGLSLCLISILVGRRAARRISIPLTRAAERIRGIAASLSESVGCVDTIPDDPKKFPNAELANLEHAVALFEHVYGKTDEMRKALDEERSKAFASSKFVALGEMAGGVAHEINSPLAIITTLAGQLKDMAQEAEIDRTQVGEASTQIESTAFRIAKIVNGLRAFTRNASRDPFVPVPINQILTDTTAFCADKFKHHGVELRIEPIPDVTLECRPSEIAQILLNLLNNSYDAVLPLKERWTKISAEDCGDQIKIRVTDSGSGIPEATASRLFQPFFTTKEIGKGTGLGLGISRKLAENHQGSIDLDRQSEHTCFVISLPKVQAKTIAMRAA